MARPVYILSLYRDVYLIAYLEVYQSAVLIGLYLLKLLSILNSSIGSFLGTVYSLSKLDCFIL